MSLPPADSATPPAQPAAREITGSTVVLDRAPEGPIAARWALLVGINQYDENNIAPLKFCVNDVIGLERTLGALGYTVVCLHDAAAEKRLKPTYNNVTAEMARLCQIAGHDDLLFVYFGCHGHLLDGQPVLILQDTRFAILEKSVLPVRVVQQQMQQSRATRLILTLDACHSGVEAREVPDLNHPDFNRNAYDLATGFALIAGSTAQQVAQEWKEKQHGVFTYFLLEGLVGQADRGHKGFVTVDDMKDYLLDSVRRWIPQHGGLLQEPTARTEGRGDMILADRRHDTAPIGQKSTETPWPDQPFTVGRPIKQPRFFFGRQREVKRLFNLLGKMPLQNAAIIGPRRSGKTSLLNYLARVAATDAEQLRPEQRADYLPEPDSYRFILVDFQDPRLGSQKGLLRYLLTAMGAEPPDPCPLDVFMDLCGQQLQTPTVVLFDEIGVALERYKELDDAFFESLRFLASTYDSLAFLLAAHQSPVELASSTGHGSPFFNIFGYTATLGPLTEPEARALIKSSPRPFSPEDTGWILAKSGRWPVCLQALCRERLHALEEGEDDAREGWKEEGLRQLGPYQHLVAG